MRSKAIETTLCSQAKQIIDFTEGTKIVLPSEISERAINRTTTNRFVCSRTIRVSRRLLKYLVKLHEAAPTKVKECRIWIGYFVKYNLSFRIFTENGSIAFNEPAYRLT